MLKILMAATTFEFNTEDLSSRNTIYKSVDKDADAYGSIT